MFIHTTAEHAHTALASVLPAMGPKGYGYHLVRIRAVEGGLEFAATDGHDLAAAYVIPGNVLVGSSDEPLDLEIEVTGFFAHGLVKVIKPRAADRRRRVRVWAEATSLAIEDWKAEAPLRQVEAAPLREGFARIEHALADGEPSEAQYPHPGRLATLMKAAQIVSRANCGDTVALTFRGTLIRAHLETWTGVLKTTGQPLNFINDPLN